MAVIVCAAGALVSLALEYGFRSPPLPLPLLIGVQILAVAVYVGSRVWDLIVPLTRARRERLWVLRRLAATYKLDAILFLVTVVFLVFRFELSTRPVLKVSAVYVAVMQALLVIRLVVEAVRLNLLISQSKLHPARILTLTFLVLIVLGSLALALPRATHPQVMDRAGFSVPRHLLDCLFTATSATCVTGLTVLRTGTDFTVFGQIVILMLIQAGGLGIMMFGSVLGLLVGRQLSLKQSLALQDSLSHRTLGEMRRIIVFILILTFVVEGLGAAVLFPMWPGNMTSGQRLFNSAFHAVSAFCNAGFALPDTSLVGYRRSWEVYGAILPLIVVGGLGFPVLRDLFDGAVSVVRRHWRGRRGVSWEFSNPRRYRLRLHTRLVLLMTGLLIVAPTLAFFVFETFGVPEGARSAETMHQASGFGRILDALFYAVTCRTAGFNTVPMDEQSLTPASHMLGAILMFIGGSPGSTAGGIKTIGFTVMLLSVGATFRGRSRVEAFGRTIPEMIVRRAAVVVIVMVALVSVVTLALCFTEHVSLRAALFEAVSACGTVGLSTGLTPDLTVAGRIVIMLAMFAGRLGPLTLLIALAGQTTTARWDYPREDVVIG